MGRYRPMTVSELGQEFADASNDELRWRLSSEFVKEFHWEPGDTRHSLLEGEPPPTGSQQWDVFLAALAEHLAARDGRRGPAWADRRRLRRFWFPVNTRAARVDAIVHAPAAFRRRGVFVPARDLEVA